MTPPDLRARAEDVARQFHEAYERLAPAHGYETRDATRVPWEAVPAPNRALMIATVAEVVGPLLAGLAEALDEWAYCAQYKGEPLSTKHGDAADIARLRALLAPEAPRG